MASREQRQTERFDVEREIEITRGETTTVGRTVNLSLGGALIDADISPSLTMGEMVTVRFTLPDLDTPIAVEARVRWVNDRAPSRAGVQFAAGLRAKETWAFNRLFDRLRGRG